MRGESVAAPAALIAGRYRLVRLVGSGGMGAVWEARDERLERRVALKLLHRPSGVSSTEADLASVRAMREARITARLYHPHAVQVYDVIEHEGQPCLIMHFIPSMTLAAVLAEGGPLQPEEAAQVGAQVASALAAAHAAGIVHRDVKPGNILIADDGNALISDFGIARALGDATLTTSGLVHGTPAYLAPEVARGGESNFASDVFSLGSTLYGAIEGTPPFGADQNSIALLHRVAAGEFPPPQRCGALTPIVMQMLSADPGARPSMRRVADRLAELASRNGSAALTRTLTSATPAAGLSPVPEAPGPEARSLSPSKTADTKTGPSTSSGAEANGLSLSKTAESGPEVRPGPSAGSGSDPPVKPRRNRAMVMAAAVLALAGIGVLLALVLPDDRRGADPQAGPGPSTAAAPASTSPSSVSTSSASTPPTRSPSATREPSPTPRRDPTPTATPQTTVRPPTMVPTATTAPTVGGTPTAAQLRQAITSYYALMPRNTDAGWPRMTGSYQTNHAGGRAAYQQFWDAVDRITLSNVTGSPPNSAQATITYYFKDGRVVRERTAYGLVNEGGLLKISSSTVLSSVTV
jgi:serine/threonine protein kinase